MASKNQIDDLRNTLISRREILVSNISDSRENIDQLKEQDINDDLDYAELSSDSFTAGMIANHQIEELNQINDAITRIDTDNYGDCDMCGVKIPIGRLKAKPFARYCTECREVYEKEQMKKSS